MTLRHLRIFREVCEQKSVTKAAKKLFISQPMRGKSDEEILKERKAAVQVAEEALDEKVEVVE